MAAAVWQKTSASRHSQVKIFGEQRMVVLRLISRICGQSTSFNDSKTRATGKSFTLPIDF
ncbi:hypothetical protein C7S18_08595 [Ahniella affigens]|uniref:Uncharacterized protein n=1 Tax=Ahniella affigens TaxID=2021234 RepID=A0A2P1PR03_9GAMM|nr:hypothetical protein C7S18_08595 [Ahniella affigens]